MNSVYMQHALAAVAVVVEELMAHEAAVFAVVPVQTPCNCVNGSSFCPATVRDRVYNLAPIFLFISIKLIIIKNSNKFICVP